MGTLACIWSSLPQVSCSICASLQVLCHKHQRELRTFRLWTQLAVVDDLWLLAWHSTTCPLVLGRLQCKHMSDDCITNTRPHTAVLLAECAVASLYCVQLLGMAAKPIVSRGALRLTDTEGSSGGAALTTRAGCWTGRGVGGGCSWGRSLGCGLSVLKYSRPMTDPACIGWQKWNLQLVATQQDRRHLALNTCACPATPDISICIARKQEATQGVTHKTLKPASPPLATVRTWDALACLPHWEAPCIPAPAVPPSGAWASL